MMREMGCDGIQRFIDTYLDGEFAERDRAEFETHLQLCAKCQSKVKQQAMWKLAIKAAAPRELVPASLRNKVMRSIAKESAAVQTRRWVMRIMPAAAAAGLVVIMGVAPLMNRLSWSRAVSADVIAKHQRNLPLEISGGSEQVKQWYAGKVDFPVKPPSFDQVASKQMSGGAKLRGGRLTNVRDRQAAYLQYDMNGERVGVFMFDPSQLPLGAKSKRVVGNRDVYFDQENGSNVALFEDRGVGYAITSDLDQDQMVSLVSATVSH